MTLGGIVATAAGAVTLAAALLLGAAGIFKLVRPAETAGALRAVGLPQSVAIVRVLAVVEVAVAVWVMAVASTASLITLIVAYSGFALFVMFALMAEVPLRSCGCFGKLDTPPSGIHVAVDGVIAGLAFVAAIRPETAIGAIWDAGVVAWLGVAVLAYLLFGMMTALPLVARPARAR